MNKMNYFKTANPSVLILQDKPSWFISLKWVGRQIGQKGILA